MARKKSSSARSEITDVDGILKRAEADRNAANRVSQPRQDHHYYDYSSRTIYDEPPSGTAREDSPAQRAAERYVAGNRPTPQGFKSARERKAAKQQQNANSKKQASRKKP